jgi:hypothetical protein
MKNFLSISQQPSGASQELLVPERHAAVQDATEFPSNEALLTALVARFADRWPVIESPAEALKKTLLTLKAAEQEFGFSRVSFWRFRKRHRIHLLPGRRVSTEDILAGFSADRAGQRRMPLGREGLK